MQIIETVIPEGDAPHQGKLQDIVMLALPGGEERTEAETELLSKVGYELDRVIPTESPVSIIEALPA